MNRQLSPESELPLSEDPRASFTMPANWYLDADIFEREKQAIFYQGWHYVTHQSALSNTGDYASLRIADENVFVIKDSNGEIRGFYNVCRHRAHELLTGTGNTSSIVCPYHAWAYELNGALRKAPNADSLPHFDKSQYCLKPVRVEDFCGLIFVNLDEDAISLAEQAADLKDDLMQKLPWMDELKIVDYCYFGDEGTKANWKVVVDNYLECYHCSKAHPDFVDLVCIDDYELDVYGIWSRQTGAKTRPQNSAYKFSADDPVQDAYFWYLWPTTTINIIPGGKMIQILSIIPQSLETTSFAGHRLAVKDGPDGDRMEYLLNVLAPEDQSLVESVQRGLKSQSYNQGPFVVDESHSGIAEHAVHHFHRLVQQAIGE